MIDRDEILEEIEKELDFELAEAPATFSTDALKAIRQESVAYSKHILDALTTEELQSESAWMRFRQGVLAEARMRMHERR